MTDAEVLDALRDAFRQERRLGSAFVPGELTLADDGTLTLAAEVASVAAKKRALEIAAAPPEVRGVVDRVRVAVAEPMQDGDILAHLGRFFLGEPAFGGFAIRAALPGIAATEPRFPTVLAHPDDPRGRIDIEVRNGVVILNGEVPGLVSQRLAGVMAWRVPGVRDVVNGLTPVPPEEDAPIRIEEAVRVVLDRNPSVNDSQIRIGVRGRVVRLTGAVRSQAERAMAEADAWCVLGVDEVINDIELAPRAPAQRRTAMAVTHAEVKRLFGDVTDHVIVEILDSGATLAELEEVAAHLAQETDVMGELERPLTGRALRLYTLLRRDEEDWEEDR